MRPEPPDILARYFAAQNAHDIDAMTDCFAPDAQVRDEGRDHHGRAAIRAWLHETSEKYRVQVEPLELRREEGLTVVVARVSGDFPGSPADLTFRFGLADGRVSTLAVS